jgi:hypothetical protein
MQMANREKPIHETDHATIRRFRIFYWVITIVGVSAFTVISAFLAEDRVAAIVVPIISFAGAACAMLLNGFYMVIGVRLYDDRLQIITPLAEDEYPWDWVEVRRYPLSLRTDILVEGKLWPYMFAFWPRQVKQT